MRFNHSALIAACLLMPAFVPAQAENGFVGMWRQDVAESSPKGKPRTPKQLNVKMDGDTLTLTITGPGKVHQVDVTYLIGGPEVTYTGLDGDEFHMKVTRDGDSLVFEGKERERGSEHPVRETWTLRNKPEGRVLVAKKDAQDPNEPAQAATEYERVK